MLSITNKMKSRAKKSEASDDKMEVVRFVLLHVNYDLQLMLQFAGSEVENGLREKY